MARKPPGNATTPLSSSPTWPGSAPGPAAGRGGATPGPDGVGRRIAVVVAKGSRASLPTSAGAAGSGSASEGAAGAPRPPATGRHRALEHLARVRGQLERGHLEARLDVVRARPARAARVLDRGHGRVLENALLRLDASGEIAQLAVGPH